MNKLREFARAIKSELAVVWHMSRDPRFPMLPKVIAIIAVGYAISPIDLIPDFIPVLGYLDDLIILPFLIWLVISLSPKELYEEYRLKKDELSVDKNNMGIVAAVIILLFWLVILVVVLINFLKFA